MRDFIFKSMRFPPANLQLLHRAGFPKGDLSCTHMLEVTFEDACFFLMTKEGEFGQTDLIWDLGFPNSRHLGYCCGQRNSGQCH